MLVFVFRAFAWLFRSVSNVCPCICDLVVTCPVIQLLKSSLCSLRSNPCLDSVGMKPGVHKQLYEVISSSLLSLQPLWSFVVLWASLWALARQLLGFICPALLCTCHYGIWDKAVRGQKENPSRAGWDVPPPCGDYSSSDWRGTFPALKIVRTFELPLQLLMLMSPTALWLPRGWGVRPLRIPWPFPYSLSQNWNVCSSSSPLQ